jgi:phage terminase large subunit-like protein
MPDFLSNLKLPKEAIDDIRRHEAMWASSGSPAHEVAKSVRQFTTFYVTVILNPWMKHQPFFDGKPTKQAEFLSKIDTKEILFGGAAAGGKSEASLMAATQFVNVPGYSAIIFRRKLTDLNLSGGLMDRAADWFSKTQAKWSSTDGSWTFPSSAKLSFGYLDKKGDRERYRSSEYTCICFEELTDFPREEDYTYLFRSLRKPDISTGLELAWVPLRMRDTCNPGGAGSKWVKKRFITANTNPKERLFIPATLADNPFIDQAAYRDSLKELDSRTRRQQEFGDWSDFEGSHFKPRGSDVTEPWPRWEDHGDKFAIPDGSFKRYIIPNDITIVTAVDWASTRRRKEGKQSDHTAIATGGMTPDGRLLFFNLTRKRVSIEHLAAELEAVCIRHRPAFVVCEDDPLSRGVALSCRQRPMIPEIRILPIGSKNKLHRASQAIMMGQNYRIYLPKQEPPWFDLFCDELTAFDWVEGEKNEQPDDIVDALGLLCRITQQLRGSGGITGDMWPSPLTPPRGDGAAIW